MNSRPKYLILGTGAIGSVLGGLLQESGCDVTYLGRGRHFTAALEKGLRITGIWGEHFVPADKMKGFTNYTLIEEKFQAILLCVKSTQTEEAAKQAAALLEDDGIVVSMQNGLNNWETIARHAGNHRTVGGRVIFGSEIHDPGTALVSVNADDVLMGVAFSNVNQEILERLNADLNKAGVPSRLVSPEEIRSALWSKVLYNSALNPLSAILGVAYGDLGENGETREIMKQVIKEIFAVIEKMGVEVPFKGYEDYYAFFIEKLLPPTVGHHSSMLQDISNGRRTEIDALNGAISQYAREMNMETPYNDFLTRMVKFKESSTRS
jgi:2-dehydropantoate 2-reductase